MTIDEEVQRELNHHADDDKRVHDAFSDRIGDIEKRMNVMEAAIGSKLSWPWFIGTMLTIGALQMTMFGYLIAQVSAVQKEQQATRNEVSALNGKLEPFDFIRE